MNGKKGAMSIEYLAAFIIVIVVVAIIIFFVSSKFHEGGESVNNIFDDNGDYDGDGIINAIDTNPCEPDEGRDCLDNG